MAIVAKTLGARVIEKHFTLNRSWKGTDHSYSLAPSGLRRLVRDLRRARVAMGDGKKKRFPCEEKPLYKMGKKIVAARDIAVGSVLKREDLTIKAPGDGLPPYELDKIIGKRTVRTLQLDENISFGDLTDV